MWSIIHTNAVELGAMAFFCLLIGWGIATMVIRKACTQKLYIEVEKKGTVYQPNIQHAEQREEIRTIQKKRQEEL